MRPSTVVERFRNPIEWPGAEPGLFLGHALGLTHSVPDYRSCGVCKSARRADALDRSVFGCGLAFAGSSAKPGANQDRDDACSPPVAVCIFEMPGAVLCRAAPCTE